MIARAIREKKAVLANNSKNDPQVVFGQQYADIGVRSMVVLPLIVAFEAIGVLALYSEEAGFFDEEALRLLIELAGDIGFAVNHIGNQERLDYLAYYDVLTGLANRRLFLDRVSQPLRNALNGGYKLAMFVLDLERFRNINDSLGRPVGDALLRKVARWLTQEVKDPSQLAHLGADHFAILLPQVRPDGNLAHLVEKSMAAFLDHPFALNDAVFRIPYKVGVALFPGDGTDADILFRNAEVALKRAKALGERYLFYTPSMTAAVAASSRSRTSCARPWPITCAGAQRACRPCASRSMSRRCNCAIATSSPRSGSPSASTRRPRPGSRSRSRSPRA